MDNFLDESFGGERKGLCDLRIMLRAFPVFLVLVEGTFIDCSVRLFQNTVAWAQESGIQGKDYNVPTDSLAPLYELSFTLPPFEKATRHSSIYCKVPFDNTMESIKRVAEYSD